MKPIVNVDVSMPKYMLKALTLLETYCVATGTENVDYEFVSNFLHWQFGDEIANKFKPDYLYQ